MGEGIGREPIMHALQCRCLGAQIGQNPTKDCFKGNNTNRIQGSLEGLSYLGAPEDCNSAAHAKE